MCRSQRSPTPCTITTKCKPALHRNTNARSGLHTTEVNVRKSYTNGPRDCSISHSSDTHASLPIQIIGPPVITDTAYQPNPSQLTSLRQASCDKHTGAGVHSKISSFNESSEPPVRNLVYIRFRTYVTSLLISVVSTSFQL